MLSFSFDSYRGNAVIYLEMIWSMKQAFLLYSIQFISQSTKEMDNLYLDYLHITNHTLQNIEKVHYQSATNLLIILHSPNLSLYTFNTKNNAFEHSIKHGPIEEIQNETILLIEYLLQQECILCIGKGGSIFTIDKNGCVDVKAQNEEGINGATVSPTQEYIYVVTNNKSLIQLNKEFDLVNEILLDQHQEVLPNASRFSWRADGNFFTLNYQTVNGHKSITKDIMMAAMISPAKSDPTEDGLVQSVSQKGRKNMLDLVSWQPSGGIIAGVDYSTKEEKKAFRIIFWEKNGLRHLEFNLPSNTLEVLQLFWSLDSSILFVKIIQSNKTQKLLAYHRANYHWFLKNVISIKAKDICLPLSSQKSKHHKLLIVSQSKFQVIEYSIRNSEKEWKTQLRQRQSRYEYVYFVDGNIINITDLSRCLMPPPMSMIKQSFTKNVVASYKKDNSLLVITEDEIRLIDLIDNKNIKKYTIKQSDNLTRVYNLKLLSCQPLRLVIGPSIYEITDENLLPIDTYKSQQESYSIKQGEQLKKVIVHYSNEQLKINSNILSSQCTSFIFYHQFLIFTVATSNMYDKLFVVNLFLDEWIHSENHKIKDQLVEFQSKDLLNHRLVQRGSKIVGINQGRVVFQLPRGNLEGIYPKIIMINQVKKKIALKDYKTAYEIIRTHKLDFNLLYDVDYEQFVRQIDLVLKCIKRVDYINLFVSQITEKLSTQLQYAFSSKQLADIQQHFSINYQGKKVKLICKIISQSLRSINKAQYILSIFTSEIREGKLNEVLFEIKQLKKNDVQVVTAPHLSQNQAKKDKKKISSQEILQYVCWLVDANAIYEAALLTYDLQLAAMTARCTQKDPKEYIPYLQSLKSIENVVQFRKKICLDLKRYEIAVKELAKGTIEQRNQSLELIKKHKLFKHGVLVYTGQQQLRKVKEIIIEELQANGQINEAYRVCQSIGQHKKALDMATKAMDTKKIKETIEILFKNRQQQIKQAVNIIDKIKDDVKNRRDLARLLAFAQQYEEAVSIYLKNNEYRKAYKYLWNVSEQFRRKDMIEGFQLCQSIKRNEIIRDKKDFLQKYSRLMKVHKHKAQFGQITSFRPRQNDDMYSEVSVSSKAQSSNYTISTTTGMRKKKDKKRSILSRNVKQGSLLEEEYLIAYIKSLEDNVQDTVKDAKLLIQHLICLDLIQQAQVLRNEVREYIETFRTYKIKSYAKIKFEELHPTASELYFQEYRFSTLAIDSFNYLF